MEILVILMLALILFIIAVFVTLFVVMKKRHSDKDYRHFDDDVIDESDEEIILLENSDNHNFQDEIVNNDDNFKEEIYQDKTFDNETSKDDKVVPLDNVPIEDNSMELINVFINKNNYIFLANGNVVKKDDKIEVLLNKHVYHGIVTKANYRKDISNLKVKPKELIINHKEVR